MNRKNPLEWFKSLSTKQQIGVGFIALIVISLANSWNVMLRATDFKPSASEVTLYGALAYAALWSFGTYLHFLYRRGLGHLIQAIQYQVEPTSHIWRAWMQATYQVGAVVVPLLVIGLIGITFGSSPYVVILATITHHQLFFRALRGDDHTGKDSPTSPPVNSAGPVPPDLRETHPDADRVAVHQTSDAAMAQPAPAGKYDGDTVGVRPGVKETK